MEAENFLPGTVDCVMSRDHGVIIGAALALSRTPSRAFAIINAVAIEISDDIAGVYSLEFKFRQIHGFYANITITINHFRYRVEPTDIFSFFREDNFGCPPIHHGPP